MSPRAQRTALALAAILVGAVWGGYLAAGHLAGHASILDRIEAPLADLRSLLAGTRPPPEDIVLVAIDDRAIERFGRFPLPRSTVADLVRTISRAGPRAIGIDLLFVQEGAPAEDAALAEALVGGPFVLAAAARFASTEPFAADRRAPDALPVAADAVFPIDGLRHGAAIGFTNVTADWSGVPRHAPLLFLLGGRPYPSFALRLATAAAGSDAEFAGGDVRVGQVVSRLDHGAHLPLRFYGPSGTLRTVSAVSVLDDPTVAASLKGRVVLIGATALAAGDAFTTSFGAMMPGVEVLGTAVGHLLSGDGLVRTQAVRRFDAAVTLLLPILAVALMSLRSGTLGIALVAVMLAGWAAAVSFAYSRGMWLNMALPIAALVPTALLYGAARSGWEARRAYHLAESRRTLRRFQSPALADRLEAEPRFLDKPVLQDACIVFVDLTGFTSLSERVGPERTQDVLRHFHHLLDGVVGRHGGVVLAYMGDGAMAAFGVPVPKEGDPAAAVAAATELGTRVVQDLADLAPDAARLGVKVGAHAGPVMVSRLGGETHQHITITGDSVNVASRLQKVADDHGAVIACSDELIRRAELSHGPVPGFGPPFDVAIRGRAHPLRIRLWPERAPARAELAPSGGPG